MKKILLLLMIFQFASADTVDSKEYIAKKNYIEQVIKNGSSGHKYPIGGMPPYMIPESEHSNMASYIASGLTGDIPKGFAHCAICHGKDGRGNNGLAPNLIKMPIFVSVVKSAKNSKEHLENAPLAELKELETFPEDYEGKHVFLQCFSLSVSRKTTKDEKFKYSVRANCSEKGKIFAPKNNPFRLQLVTTKEHAKTIMSNGDNGTWILTGYVKKNNVVEIGGDYLFYITQLTQK